MMVKEEIQQMFKVGHGLRAEMTWCQSSLRYGRPSDPTTTHQGMFTATLCPALTLWMTTKGYSQAYCGVSEAHGELPPVLVLGVVHRLA